MRVVFDALGILLILASLGTCAMSKSSIHEAVGVAILIAAAVFLVGGALLKELQDIKRRLSRPPGQ